MDLIAKSLMGSYAKGPIDPYFEYTTLLLSGNGLNGAQNGRSGPAAAYRDGTFLDGSTNNFTITRNGNTTQGTFSPFSQTGWSYYVPEQVSNQVNFTTSAGTDFQFAGDFTIEGWVYAENNSGDGSVFVVSDNTNYLALNISISANVFNIYLNNSSPASITSDIAVNTWTHVAMVRSGSGTGNIKLYTNGVLKGSTTNTSTLGYANPTICRIGGGVSGINRYYSNLRVCKSAVYTGAFTPSTIPLTTTSQSATNCVLLTANSNRFLNQAVGATATITGSPRVVAFSPFNPTASWSAATNGGSGYFDGSGDYLTTPNVTAFQFGSGDFTVEMWVYLATPIGTKRHLFHTGNNLTGQFNMRIETSGKVFVFANDSGAFSLLSSTALTPYQWYHIAFSRSGSTNQIFLNGAVAATATNSYSYSGSGNVQIGYWTGDTSEFMGYMTDTRVVKGTAVYTAAFTPPTAPLTAITNTSLLLNFTNAGIYDATSKNDLETVGNAQISNTTAKWGSTSIKFDGNGDYLLSNAASTDLYAFGSGNFTIEFWTYFTNTTGDGIIYDSRGVEGAYPTIYRSGTTIIYYTNSASRITSGTIAATTWYHVVVCRSGTSTKMFIDGVQAGSTYTDSTVYLNAAQRPIVGAAGVSGFVGVSPFNGYIQDLRITKGYARYTANFTPPTAAFPTL